MAINPNTDFTAGAILTAAQQNRFPRGVMAFAEATSTTSSISSEAVQITLGSFTAVANRYYKVTYFEPILNTDTILETITMRVRLTNISGAIQQTAQYQTEASQNVGNSQTLSFIKTFSAGSVVLVATLQTSVGSFAALRSASSFAYLSVEDIGPA
jgi:hypothetical protein